MIITPLTEASEKALADINKLLVQLRESPDEHDASHADLEAVVGDANAVLMTVQDEGRIVGMGTLYILQKLGKRVAHIEDVIVLDEYRGQGLGQKLVEAIIEAAKLKNIRTLSLTSRPARAAANKLYQKVGFTLKETNVYRMKF